MSITFVTINSIECTLLYFYAVHFLRFQIVAHLIRNRLYLLLDSKDEIFACFCLHHHPSARSPFSTSMSLNLCCFNFLSRKRKVNAIENPETANEADHDNEQILSNGIITKPPGSERDQTFDPQVSFETVKKSWNFVYIQATFSRTPFILTNFY